MSDGHNSDVGFSTTSKSNVEQLECHLHSFPTIWTSKDSAGRSLGKVGWLSSRTAGLTTDRHTPETVCFPAVSRQRLGSKPISHISLQLILSFEYVSYVSFASSCQ